MDQKFILERGSFMKKTKKTLSILLAACLTLGSGLLPSYPPLMAAENTDTVSTSPVTVTPDPSLGTVDGSKELPNLLFRTPVEGGAVSNNISKNNYSVTGKAVNSFLEENEDGSFLRIEHINSELVVEKYDSGFTKAETVTKLTLPLPEYGGYFKGENARYLVCGEANTNESNEKEVVRIIQYDNDWKELDHLSIYGANTYKPFAAGSLQMTEMNGILYVHGSHTMYASSDGKHHQANMDFAVKEDTMELVKQHTNISFSGTGGHGYVSHSFCQRIAQDGTDIYLFDHGDAYPRCAYLQKIDGELEEVSQTMKILKFDGATGDNKTGASIGNIEIIGDNIFTAGNSTEQFGEEYNPSDHRRNIWISIVDKKMESQKFVWLTDHENMGNWNARTPYLLPASDGGCYVIWEDAYEEKETSGDCFRFVYKYALTKIAKIQPDGTIDGEIHTIYANLSDCKPVITSDQKLVWYTTGNTFPVFYKLDLNQLSSYEFSGFGDIAKCSITIASDSYDYENPGYEKNDIGPEVLSITYGGLELIKDVDYYVIYSNNYNVGTGYIYIVGKGIFQEPATDSHDSKLIKIPFQVKYPFEPEDTEEPEGTPVVEPSWFYTSAPSSSMTPGSTRKPSTTKVPGSTRKPSTTNASEASLSPAATTSPKRTPYPRRTAKPAISSTPVTPEKMTGIRLVNLKGKKMMLTWTKQDNVSGYQLQYAMNKKFNLKKKTLSCSKYRSMKLISGLKKNKTYYVRMRAYVQTDSGNLYGKWSKKMKCKIKK